MKRGKRKNNKAQHEIVGFILIVIIVVTIGLFLLVYYLRDEPAKYQSLNVQNFLKSSMQYTTSCSLSIEPLDMEDLIKSCYKDEICLDNRTACEVLNNTLPNIIHESWLVSADRPENAYLLTIYYEETGEAGESPSQEILQLEEGNCTGIKTSAEHPLHYGSGNIIIVMELCYT